MKLMILGLGIAILSQNAFAGMAANESLPQILDLARDQPVFKQALLDEIKWGPDRLIGAACSGRVAPMPQSFARAEDLMRAQAHQAVRGLLADLGTVIMNKHDLASALGEQGFKDLWYASKSLSEIDDLAVHLADIRSQNLLEQAADRLDALFDGDRGPHSPVAAGSGQKKPAVRLTKPGSNNN